MPLETSDLKQKAILWEFVGKDSDGQDRVSSPVLIRCRWDEGLRESISEDASPNAISNSMPCDRSIPINSIVRLLEQTEWNDWRTIAAAPGTLAIVVDRQRTPDLKARHTRYSVSLQRYSDSLPVIV